MSQALPVSEIAVAVGTTTLRGRVRIPPQACGLVLFAHGSGSGRLSPRNNYVAERLGSARLATLLFDLLTAEEEQIDSLTAELRFDIPLLTERLIAATAWARRHPPFHGLAIGYFGASTGAAAALAAAARVPAIGAVVSRGGRPDLAGPDLARVHAATLLIVGGDDPTVLDLNRAALAQLSCEARLEVIPRATHLFEEPGALEQVAVLASDWLASHLGTRTAATARTARGGDLATTR
jgi:putative phosphoribosyl transferase